VRGRFIERVDVKIVIDEALCHGHARCNALAPDVYELDDVGYADDRGKGERDVASEQEQAARRGAEACPEGAIRIID
jgi:ferredoxin